MDTQTSQALKDCQDIQHMIDITSQHLDRLRCGFTEQNSREKKYKKLE